MPIPSAKMRAAIREGRPLVLLAYIDHPDGALHVWSGVGTLSYNGHDWTGLGVLGRVSPIKSEMATHVFDFDLELRGLPADVEDTITDTVRNRPATVYLAALDAHQNVVPDAIELISGVMDYQTVDVGEDGSSTIRVRVIGGVWVLDTALNQSWTTEEQVKVYPGDTGFDLMPGLVSKQVNWAAS